MNRVYLPLDSLQRHNVDANDLSADTNWAQRVKQEILQKSGH